MKTFHYSSGFCNKVALITLFVQSFCTGELIPTALLTNARCIDLCKSIAKRAQNRFATSSTEDSVFSATWRFSARRIRFAGSGIVPNGSKTMGW